MYNNKILAFLPVKVIPWDGMEEKWENMLSGVSPKVCEGRFIENKLILIQNISLARNFDTFYSSSCFTVYV